MRQYLKLLRSIRDEGRSKMDRTGTGCKSLFGTRMRFDLSKGFPLVTTRKMFLRGGIEELLWFLRGSTDNEELVEKDVHLWDQWALKEDVKHYSDYAYSEVIQLLANSRNVTRDEIRVMVREKTVDEIVEMMIADGIPTVKEKILIHKGALGPIYGEQWCAWKDADGKAINQIAELIENLKNKPFSRRHVITAWNPSYLPDETISPEANVLIGKMALAPCHCLFQFYVEELTISERIDIKISTPEGYAEFQQATDITNPENKHKNLETILNDSGVPNKRLSCQLYQRSADTPVGVPTNIASYSLLTMMIAQCVGMVPGDFIWTGGDTHIYSNQFEGVETQLSREPRPLPKMIINPDVKDIFSFKVEDFTLVGYDPHDRIIYPVAK